MGSRGDSTELLWLPWSGLASLHLQNCDSVCDTCVWAGCSLDWNCYQHVHGGQQQADEAAYFDYNDFDANEMTTIANILCGFGNDWLNLTIPLNTDVEPNAQNHLKSICDGKSTSD